ncbi:MAG: hypothetical protein QM831_32775 [Kofleriaceae bacterium]
MRRLAFLFALAACGSSTTPGIGDDTMGDDDGSNTGSGSGSNMACTRTAGAADAPRFIVVSHSYTQSGDKSTKYEVLHVDTAGAITRGAQFDMNRTSFGSIQFTPDGKVGIAVSDEMGTLGVFTLADDGTPTVVDPGFGTGMFYAERVVIDPTGTIAYVLDGNTRGTNGGGVYAVQINCDATLTFIGKLADASTPRGMILDGDRAFLAATSTLDAPAGSDVTMLQLAGTMTPTVMAGADAFGNDNAVFGGFGFTTDKSTILVGNTSFAGNNTVATVSVTATTMTPGVQLSIADPESIETSPFDNTAIVTTADGDKITILNDQGTNGAWQIKGTFGSPQQPGDTAQIHRGALNGHVFISELSGIHHIAFGQGGTVTEVGFTDLTGGDDNDLVDLPGAIGITP